MSNADERWDAVEEGAELLQTGELEEAVAELMRVTEAQPENDLAHNLLGTAFFEKRDYEKALKCYVRALEISPKFVGAMVGAGQSLRMLGRAEHALRLARQALLVSKEDPDALFLAGCLCYARGEGHAAKTYLDRFLETKPEIEAAIEARGMLKSIMGDDAPFEEQDD
jgi:tetratricopeptide (TPR) repeat protein